MNTSKNRLEKIIYGSFFTVVYPVYMIFLTRNIKVSFSIGKYPVLGTVLVLMGLTVTLRAMYELKSKGKGLPMNAFPPKNLVEDGIYGIISHPIYSGFCLFCIGMVLFHGLATGFFITVPVIMGGCIALVLGYENIYLKKKFGKYPEPALSFRKIFSPVIKVMLLDKVWKYLLNWSEKMANSWKSYRIGKVRIINHFIYSGLAGGTGASIVVLILGKEYIPYVFTLMIIGILGAAIIGQILVGSTNKLSRPFGYFGSLIGISAAGLILSAFRWELFRILAAFSVAAPVTQAIGRIRCLIQGCCHGERTAEGMGITVENPHSRVCMLSHKCGVPIHSTQLYSIIGNIVLEGWLLLLWFSGIKLTVIAGVYLVGAGIIRFIEEAYRGEPLTKIIGNLRIYQWFSLVMYFSGMIIMAFPSENTFMWNFKDYKEAIVAGIVFFIISSLAMSTDFPDSNFRYSRLSG